MTFGKIKYLNNNVTLLAFFLVLGLYPKFALSQTMRSDQWQNDIPNFAFYNSSRGFEYMKKGLKYLEQKQPDKARTEFNRALRPLRDAIKGKNDYYAATYNLALAYYLRNIEGDRQLALDTFAKAAGIAEGQKINDPALYNTIGKIHFENMNYEEAEKNFKKSLEIDKDYAEAINNLAAVSERRGNIKAALGQYQRAGSLGSPQGRENFQRLSPLEKK